MVVGGTKALDLEFAKIMRLAFGVASLEEYNHQIIIELDTKKKRFDPA